VSGSKFNKGGLAGGQPVWLTVFTEAGTSQTFGPYTVAATP
jgi:hypothetical protein